MHIFCLWSVYVTSLYAEDNHFWNIYTFFKIKIIFVRDHIIFFSSKNTCK